VPESRAARHRRPDPLGQVLVIVLLASLTYAIIEGSGSGWASAKILFFFGLALVALIIFGIWESRRADPLIDPRFFRSAAILRGDGHRGDRRHRPGFLFHGRPHPGGPGGPRSVRGRRLVLP
jgi:hypothetical protein